jgi:fermentation-respiration switch protein FrsA (DUF1100 family)
MMRRGSFRALVAIAVVLAVPSAVSADTQSDFNLAINEILDQRYQPAYAPMGFDSAFPMDTANPNGVLNTAPAQDYTSGSVPGNPDHPNWPSSFQYVRFLSGDGAPLRAYYALHSGSHPGVVVVHGFNTNGKESVIRWAAMLYANGYNVIASDQRDFRDEVRNPDGTNRVPSDGYPDWLQTFGWKEATDVLAAGQFLKSRPGVTSVGVWGVSLGAQDTILAMSLDPMGQVFSAGITFSGPADQNAQIYSTAAQPGCTPPNCTYPVTNALIALVVPPYGNGGKYTEPCGVLVDAGLKYGTSPSFILNQLKAYRRQQQISVPLLNFYTADDSLVAPFHATMMAGYEQGEPLQRTYLVDQGEHAYFFDRWWQQKASLIYFKRMLPGAFDDGTITMNATVNPAAIEGSKMVDQLAQIGDGSPSPAEADALQAPVICAGPTAVTVRSFTASRPGHTVVLRWRTGPEFGLAGFNLYRERGARARLNRSLISASGDGRGHRYLWRGRVGNAGRFWLELVRLDGSRTLQGPVSP